MIIDPTNLIPTPYALITRMMHDASQLIFDTTDPRDDFDRYPNLDLAPCEPFISDDSTDYLDCALDLLHMTHDAMIDDDRDNACAALLDRMIRCDLPEFFTCLHQLAIDFDSPIFDLIPDDCPHNP